ncbi:MAG: cell division protein FtsA [Chloroflexi bacterium]|nr:cell division protein FtsA [Chloroflexota bacterium]
MERTVVGIDVGSSKVCTLVGEVDDEGDVRVIGVGLVPSRGIRKGVVVNVADATGAIAASVEKAERTSGYKIERAYVGLSGTHLSSLNSRGVVGISRREHGITVDDVDRALDAAHAIAVPHSQEVVHVIPRGYVVDGQDGVRDPIGIHGFRLEVEAHIVTSSSTAIQNLTKCVERAGVEVDELVLASMAAGDAVLTETEREMGVVLADIGSGTTDIAIFIDGTVWHTVTLGVGGEYITGDIAIGLRLPPAIAEQVKVEHGHAIAAQVSPEDRFTVSAFGGGGSQAVPRWKLAEIIEARAEEILSMIQQEIKRSGYDGLLSAGVVLCGGTPQLPGIQELGRDILGLPVRVGAPRELYGLVDKVSNPAHAVSAGLMGWGVTVDTRPQLRKIGPSTGRRFLNWLRAFLPG